MLTIGTVKAAIADDDTLLHTLLVESDGREYVFVLEDTAWLVDGAGNPAAAEAMVHKTVAVIHDEAMTLSLPPKSATSAVMVYDDILPNYAVVEDVFAGADGTVILTTDNGDRLVTIAADAYVSLFHTGNIITAQDLRAGDTVVLYYDVLAPSIPARANTDRVVQLAAVQ